MNWTQRAALVSAGSITVVLLFTGCVTTGEGDSLDTTTAGNGEKIAVSLQELFQQALEQANNPFVIDVLKRAIETGNISQTDYDEAHRLYRMCMIDAGYEEKFTQLSNGSYQITPPKLNDQASVEQYMDTGTECSTELAPIESLFVTQQGNPGLLSDREQLAIQCLNQAGLVDANYTPEQFQSDLDNAFEEAEFDPMSPDAQSCFSNAGYTIIVNNQ